MIIKYFKAGKPFETSKSNEDLEIKGEKNKVSVKALTEVILDYAEEKIEHQFSKDDLFMLNGYQSWTPTREFLFSDKLKNVKHIPRLFNSVMHFETYGDSFIVDTKKNKLHGFDFCYVKGANPIFIGSYNYKNAYLVIEFHKAKHFIKLVSDIEGKKLNKGDEFVIFDYMTSNDVDGGMTSYFEPLKSRTDKKIFGYSSWYNHYQDINEEKINTALAKADNRFDLFQIDDGYETFVGDWLDVDPVKFPHGLKPIVDEVHKKGMLAGIWLAPWVAQKGSSLIANRSDLMAFENGKMVRSGFNWGGHYALDVNNPKAVEYVKSCLKHYADMGFDFFKLDFLYGAGRKCLAGKTHAETQEYAYQVVRDALGDKLILGCGATMSNGYGKFDYMRVGPDVSLRFRENILLRNLHREQMSTKDTLLNSIYRFPINGHGFLNDPDVFLLRDDNIFLTKEQKYSIMMINSLFGSLLMTSDNPKDYDEETHKVLEQGLNQFKNAKVLNYSRSGDAVTVNYELDGKKCMFEYQIETGVISKEIK